VPFLILAGRSTRSALLPLSLENEYCDTYDRI
jgi:hypothetical protein